MKLCVLVGEVVVEGGGAGRYWLCDLRHRWDKWTSLEDIARVMKFGGNGKTCQYESR